MPEKRLADVTASAEMGGPNGNTRTGRVQLRGLPTWLKGDQFVTASLTPRQATLLAYRLLEASLRATEPKL